jgi:hypothetical protein
VASACGFRQQRSDLLSKFNGFSNGAPQLTKAVDDNPEKLSVAQFIGGREHRTDYQT